jgi:hypothetical protein
MESTATIDPTAPIWRGAHFEFFSIPSDLPAALNQHEAKNIITGQVTFLSADSSTQPRAQAGQNSNTAI